jgi:hypothetical protein
MKPYQKLIDGWPIQARLWLEWESGKVEPTSEYHSEESFDLPTQRTPHCVRHPPTTRPRHYWDRRSSSPSL